MALAPGDKENWICTGLTKLQQVLVRKQEKSHVTCQILLFDILLYQHFVGNVMHVAQ